MKFFLQIAHLYVKEIYMLNLINKTLSRLITEVKQ